MNMEVTVGRQGNQRLPIESLTVSRRHCKITDNGNGQYTVENLSPAGTIVNGHKIVRTVVTADTVLQLGPEFRATVRELVGVAERRPVPTPNPFPVNPPIPTPAADKVFSISHLEGIWEEFNETNITLMEQRRRVNLIRIITSGFSMASILIWHLFGWVGMAMTIIGICGMVYSFFGLKRDETPREQQERQEDFDAKWICPNPECKRSLPAKNYRLLVMNHKKCPYCGCRFVEGRV